MSDPNRSLQSPLGRVRGLGSAKAGTHHWILLRATSIALIALIFYPLATLLCLAVHGDYNDVVAWLHTPWAAAGVVLFLGFSFHHAALGLQDVIEDYIHCKCARPAALFLVKFGAAAFTVLGTFATLKIMLGA